MSSENSTSSSLRERYASYLTFANAPAIVRAHQKDSYFESTLRDNLEDTLKVFKGQRFVLSHPEEIRVLASTLYLALTTLAGTKTLGEEYTDLIYVNRNGKRLPKLISRLGFVVSYAIVPYLFRIAIKRLQPKQEDEDDEIDPKKKAKKKSRKAPKNQERFAYLRKIWVTVIYYLSKLTYVNMLDMINLHLAFFYFSGSYYQLSKRIFGLRYVFGHRVRENQPKGNYELLGGLIFLQLIFKNFDNISQFIKDRSQNSFEEKNEAIEDTQADKVFGIPAVEVDAEKAEMSKSKLRKPKKTKTPELLVNNKIDLSDPTHLPYIPEESRKCMLCLSYMTDPTCAACGHVFCWSCIVDWCKERPECPLCRQTVLEQNLLPLR